MRGLTITAGSLAFDSATPSYTVASVRLKPTVNHAGATVVVNGAAWAQANGGRG